MPATLRISNRLGNHSFPETLVHRSHNDNNIIGLYVERIRQVFGHDSPAIIIMDNFKGQVTLAVFQQLETYNIHHCLLPANTTDHLQSVDLTVNKPIKYFLKQNTTKTDSFSDQDYLK